ncbi:MAG: CotH kinase family protein [Bacteriovoracaceae bacterium]|jgi:spore coat protein H|nr:CotH kinase family protein [Bacteriovoracaceae bacterium]
MSRVFIFIILLAITSLAHSQLREDKSVYIGEAISVINIELSSSPGPAGHTMKDLNRDDSEKDTFVPVVSVSFKSDSYPGKSFAGEMKVRGQSTRAGSRKSFKITLPKGAEKFLGQRKIHLNRHPYDLTRVRNKLSFDLLKTLPNMTSLKTNFIHLKIDGEDYGFYTQVEHTSKGWLKSRGLDKEGHLYKAERFRFKREVDKIKLKSDPTYRVEDFEVALEIKGSDDHAPLIEMLDAVNNKGNSFEAVFKKHFDEDNYLEWFATTILFGNADTSSQNFYIYSPQASSKWYFLPWDFDAAWDFYGQPDQLKNKMAPWHFALGNWGNVRLHKRFFETKGFVSRLVKKIEELKVDYLGQAKIRALLDSYKPVVFSEVKRKSELEHLPTIGSTDGQKLKEFEGEFNRLENVVEKNYKRFMNNVEKPMPVWMDEPEKKSGKKLSFSWEDSFDPQGDPVTYTVQVSSGPLFRKSDLVYEARAIKDHKHISTKRIRGKNLFFRVLSVDDKGNFEVPFDDYWDKKADKVLWGLKKL